MLGDQNPYDYFSYLGYVRTVMFWLTTVIVGLTIGFIIAIALTGWIPFVGVPI